MLFNTYLFIVFFALVQALYWLAPTWPLRKRVLLGASYVFYGAWNPPYVVLLFLATLVDWLLARAIGRSANPYKRKTLLIASLVSNLGLLSYFKYGKFLLASFTAIFPAFTLPEQLQGFEIILPIGISFYTFASLSYTVDVYRKEIRSDWTWTDYALFVSFFPHLVAGPIVRASILLPQIEHPRRPTRNEFGWGMVLFCFGLFSKVVMADTVFAPLVNQIYSKPESYGFISMWTAVFSFAGQIYYDFSGYSMCAIGLAMCFGFAFPTNFNYPYGASSFSDFWRRWHISLSSWLRDYLYIPLGGNRHGRLRHIGALALTMLIGGLWHGASWMFVLWGGLHGCYLVAELILKDKFHSKWLSSTNRSLLVTLVVTLTWIPFRLPSLSAVGAVLEGLQRFSKIDTIDFAHLCALLGFVATIAWHRYMSRRTLIGAFASLPMWKQVGVVCLCMLSLYLCSGGSASAFIYFQF